MSQMQVAIGTGRKSKDRTRAHDPI
jgi:hypothetical protein